MPPYPLVIAPWALEMLCQQKFLVVCPLPPRRKYGGALALSKTKHTDMIDLVLARNLQADTDIKLVVGQPLLMAFMSFLIKKIVCFIQHLTICNDLIIRVFFSEFS